MLVTRIITITVVNLVILAALIKIHCIITFETNFVSYVRIMQMKLK